MKKRVLSLLLALAMLLCLTACGEQAPAVYEVRFEMNGGTLVSGQLLQRIEAGGSAEAPAVERAGYAFDGWEPAFDSVTENMVVLAKWSPVPDPEPEVYEVRFEMNGGEFVSGRLLQHVEAGGSAEAPEIVREGYALSGWSEAFDSVSENIVTAALWTRLYRVVFDPAGGEVVSGETEQLLPKGDMPSAPEVERKNSAFAGWSPTVDAVDGDAVYTARWSAVRLSAEEVFAKISPAVVEVYAYESDGEYYNLGSGFFLDDEGTLLTNYHVVDATVSGEICTQDGAFHDILSVLAYDPTLDLAILKADITGNPYLTVSQKAVATGETIYALGSSEGLTSTFSTGIVSAASRDFEGVRYIQITAPISHGNSGGPLVNVYGEVVGVNTMGYLEGQNLNFAVDINELEKLDRSESLTLAEVFALAYPEGTAVSEDEGFYAYADLKEEEPNNSLLLSDELINGAALAGEVSDVDDLDWFCFELDGPCDVSFEVVPEYVEDADYLLCGVIRLTEDEDSDVTDVLMPSDEGEYTSLVGTVHFDEGGLYFLLVCVDDSYPYVEPVYYILEADW